MLNPFNLHVCNRSIQQSAQYTLTIWHNDAAGLITEGLYMHVLSVSGRALLMDALSHCVSTYCLQEKKPLAKVTQVL